jgi:hypothetical protein
MATNENYDENAKNPPLEGREAKTTLIKNHHRHRHLHG